MEIKKILKELEDLKFDSYDNIVNEVLDCIAKIKMNCLKLNNSHLKF